MNGTFCKSHFPDLSKPSLVITVALTVLLFASACTCGGWENKEAYTDGGPGRESGVTIALTQRQIDILKQAGLNSDFEELTLLQKSAIADIEEMLCYLEEKYRTTFIYTGYVAAGPMEREHLTAYPENGPMSDEVTVYRSFVDGAFQYEDDYQNLIAKPLYQAELEEYVGGFYDRKDFVLFCTVTQTRDPFDETNVLGNASATTWLILSERVFKEELRSFLEKYAEWIQEKSHGMSSALTACVVSPQDFSDYDRFNCEEKIRQETYQFKMNCVLYPDGHTKVF